MRFLRALCLAAFAGGSGSLIGNPIAVHMGDDFPVSAESTHARLGPRSAIVEGSFRFLWPQGFLDDGPRVFAITVPVILPKETPYEEIDRLVRPQVKTVVDQVIVGHMILSGQTDDALPEHLRIYEISWTFRAEEAPGFDLGISYEQPLFDGRFYYIPWTMPRFMDPAPEDHPVDHKLQITIHPRAGMIARLHSSHRDSLRGVAAVTVFPLHRRIIVASEEEIEAEDEANQALQTTSGTPSEF